MPTPDRPALLQPGDEIHVPTHARLFGNRPLWMRVVEAGPPFVYHDGALWQEVEGPELGVDGTPRSLPPLVATVNIGEVRPLNGNYPRPGEDPPHP